MVAFGVLMVVLVVLTVFPLAMMVVLAVLTVVAWVVMLAAAMVEVAVALEAAQHPAVHAQPRNHTATHRQWWKSKEAPGIHQEYVPYGQTQVLC